MVEVGSSRKGGLWRNSSSYQVRKTSSKEKIKAQNTSEIGTEIENMHEKIVEINRDGV